MTTFVTLCLVLSMQLGFIIDIYTYLDNFKDSSSEWGSWHSIFQSAAPAGRASVEEKD